MFDIQDRTDEQILEEQQEIFKFLETQTKQQAIQKDKDIFGQSSKITKKNFKGNDKYINTIKIFFTLREQCYLGNFGVDKKGENKQLQSIEKFGTVFLLRFTNSRPQFYSFKKASELTNISLEDIKGVEGDLTKPGIPNSVRFDLNYLLNLLEEYTKESWESAIKELTIFSNKEESLVMQDMYYQEKMLELKEHTAIRRLFTYETDRVKAKLNYAELTPVGKDLPDWFIHFKLDTYKKLTRKEQLVAHFNEYGNKFNFNTNYEVGQPSSTDIKAHQYYTGR